MQPTAEQIEADVIQAEQNRIANINSRLSVFGITRPETITKDFVLGILAQMHAEQFIWNDFSKWVDNQEILFGSLEKAFDDLVSRYL